MGTEEIRENEAHLWYGRPDDISDSILLRRFRELLSEDEREKFERYHFAEDRHSSLITRAMIRCLLSRYAAVEPSDWQDRTNTYGRPEIAKPSHAGKLRFNIAHTKGIIVILICKNRNVGIDVERYPYLGPYQEIADRFFSRPRHQRCARCPHRINP